MSTILLPGLWCHLAGHGETVIVPFNPTRWRHQCLEFNVGVYQKQELFLEFNVCVSQKQEPKALVTVKKKAGLVNLRDILKTPWPSAYFDFQMEAITMVPIVV